jgi:rRNA maturation endonuclease Nob1
LSEELVYEAVELAFDGDKTVPDALAVCGKCKHLVPKTMLCLWCGSPILFRMPKKQA